MIGRTAKATEQRYEKLVADHFPAIHRTAFRLTGGRAEDAEDLVQETFLRAGRGLAGLAESDAPRPWLFRILRNAFIDSLRRVASRPRLVSAEAPEGHNILPFESAAPESVVVLEPADFADRQTMERCFDDEVLGALEELPEDFRLPLLFHAVGGLRYEEIARALDCPLGTVMSRLHRARAVLRTRLSDYGRRRGMTVKNSTEKGDGYAHA